jgi:hypothetical protein
LIAFVSTGTVEFVNTILKYSPCLGMKNYRRKICFLSVGIERLSSYHFYVRYSPLSEIHLIQGYHFLWTRFCFSLTAGEVKRARLHLTRFVSGSSIPIQLKANLPC